MNEIIKHEPTQTSVILPPDNPVQGPPDDGLSVKIALAAVEMSRLPSGQVDVDALREIRAMAKELRDEEKIQWFARDMAAAQAEMQPVIRRAEVNLGKDKGGYKFADAVDIDEMLRPIMTKYGFSVTYDRDPRAQDGGGYVVTGTLWHRSGHYITAAFSLGLDSGPGRSNAQAAGSTDTYGRKYILLGFFNIVRKGEDDDGAMNAGAEPITRDQAARLKQLVDEAGIAAGETDLDRRASIMGWFSDEISYPIKAYTEVRQEDYARLVRLLRIEGAKWKKESDKAAEI